MAGKIPQFFIDDLLARVNIIDVLDGRVDKLKRSGKNYSGLCPFHQEKTPSFSANQDKQFYYCFGCGAGGNAIGFMMDYERIDFPQAVEELARLAGMEVPRETSPQDEQASKALQKSLDTLDKARQFYCKQLREHPNRAAAVTYLKARGLTGKIAKVYELGYAPDGWDNLTSHLESLNISKSDIERTGLAIHNTDKNRHYDRFRDRIIFPIKDPRGRVIGFGGRVLGDAKPKYLNSPETNTFSKGKELYGLYEARKLNSKIERFLVVEGYMDVIGLAQLGVTYAVAALGTAASAAHLTTLFKSVSEVIFCFDGDNAGRTAAQRALGVALPSIKDGQTIKFLFVPEGEDPDSLIRKEGKEAFEQRLNQSAKSLSDFFLETQKHNLNMASIDGRARFASQAKPHLDTINAPILKQLLTAEVNKITGYDFSVEQAQQDTTTTPTEAPSHELPTPYTEAPAHLEEYDYNYSESYPAQSYPEEFFPGNESTSRSSSNSKLTHTNHTNNKTVRLIDRLASLIVQHPSIAAQITFPDILKESPNPELQLLNEMLYYLNATPHASLSTMLIDWQESEKHQHLCDQLEPLINSELEHDQKSALQTMHDGIARLTQDHRDQRLKVLQGQKLSTLSAEERKELTNLLLNK